MRVPAQMLHANHDNHRNCYMLTICIAICFRSQKILTLGALAGHRESRDSRIASRQVPKPRCLSQVSKKNAVWGPRAGIIVFVDLGPP